MAMSARRPALAFLLALSLLTALVWWRVFNRTDDPGTATAHSTCAVQTGVALPPPTAVTVTVLNGTDRAGLAATVAGALAADGFVVPKSDNDTATVASVAEVRFGPAGAAAATLLTYYIPGATLVSTPGTTDASIVVSVGANFPTTGGVNTVAAANDGIAKAAAAASAAPGKSGSAPAC
jgi:hypothetical protein